jgi:lysophospholipase L1-like esterase
VEEVSRPRRRRPAFAAAAAVLGLLLAVLTAELSMRLLWRGSPTYRALPAGQEVTFNPKHQPGVVGPSVYKVNSFGVRGREWGDRATEFRVLCIGGSTTECLVTDQSRIWTTLLEKELGVLPDGRRAWVGNIGKSGLGTAHHIRQMKHLLPVYPLDVVVLLVGANDLQSLLKRPGGYDPRATQGPEAERLLMEQSFAVAPGGVGTTWPGDPWYKRLRLWHVTRVFKYQVLRRPEQQDPEGVTVQRWRALRAAGRRSGTPPPLEPGLAAYRKNLEEIVRLAREDGVRLVFLTQPTLWRADLTPEEERLLWAGGVGDFRVEPGALYYEAPALARALDAYNDTLRDVCRATGTTCVDLAREIPRSTEFFFDDFHFTDRAQPVIASLVAEGVRAAASGPAVAEGSNTR